MGVKKQYYHQNLKKTVEFECISYYWITYVIAASRSGKQMIRGVMELSYIVDFKNVSTVGLDSSPVAEALAGLRANESRYYMKKTSMTVKKVSHPLRYPLGGKTHLP